MSSMNKPSSPQSASKTKKADKPSGDLHGLVKTTSDSICQKNHYAVDAGGLLYRYCDGVYIRDAVSQIKRLVKRFTIATMQDKHWHRSLNADVIEFISIDAPTIPCRPASDILNCRNGLLRLRDRQLLPHSPKHLSTSQIPVTFDPQAICPAIEKFISQVFPEDTKLLGYEIPGWLMLPITSIQKAVLLNGGGGNGKSTYLNLLCRFIGEQNYSSLPLHKLESDRFAASRLIGKLANICPDLPTESLAGTSVFKAITGGDTITAEYKFRDSFDFEPFARLVFSSNSLPQSNDNSQGFFDRWVVVPFDRSFRGSGDEIPREQLDAMLTSESELSGLLNKGLDAIDGVKSRKWRLHTSETLQRAHSEFHSITDPLGVWLDQFTVDDPDAVTPKAMLRGSYSAECERKGRPVPTDRAFGLAMQQHRQGITTAQRTVNERVQWCYIGIAMRTDDTPNSQQSQLMEKKSRSQHSQDKQLIPNLLLPTNHLSGNDSQIVTTSRAQAVKAVNPVIEICDIPRDSTSSPSLDDINNMLNTDSDEVLF